MQFPEGAVAPARCVPCLRLFAETLYVDDGTRHGDEVKTAMVRLDFAYDGRRVRSRNPNGAGRDRVAELSAARVLEGLGAIELRALDDCAVAPGAGIDYVLAVDGDAHALCTFGAHAIPQRLISRVPPRIVSPVLRSQDWRHEHPRNFHGTAPVLP